MARRDTRRRIEPSFDGPDDGTGSDLSVGEEDRVMPTSRKVGAAKRKASGDVDRTQDGARAVAVEEGLAAFVFNFLEPDDFDASQPEPSQQ